MSALVIGAGPAGLMAAEALLDAGHPVILTEAKPSPARKFLMAGKSGLNITKDEPLPTLNTQYFAAESHLAPMIAAFGPGDIQAWMQGLGQPWFTGSTGRVFPVAMKASPLLRAWLLRLGTKGLDLRLRWRWRGFDGARVLFDTPEGPQMLSPDATVLALGGASWARLGSDGAWADVLAREGVALAPFQPANMGFQIDWSPHMAPHFGQAVKSVALSAAGHRLRGEFVVSARGIEGGGIYALSRELREGAALTLDLFPDLDAATIAARLRARPARESRTNRLRKALGLTGVRLALVQEWARPLPEDLAPILKTLPVPLGPPRPMDEAISTAGGIRFDALTEDLMLRARPGVFAAGEMLDWEAPTGGYLLTASMATGLWAGKAAARWIDENRL